MLRCDSKLFIQHKLRLRDLFRGSLPRGSLASIGFTYSTHFSGVLADAAELLIEPPSHSGPAVFLTC
jgi:hypothetical protein